jgi:hypothetical protein
MMDWSQDDRNADPDWHRGHEIGSLIVVGLGDAGCGRALPRVALITSIMTQATQGAAERFRAWAIIAFTSSIRPTT